MFGSAGFALAASSSPSSSSFPSAAPERQNDSSTPSATLRTGPNCGRGGVGVLVKRVLNLGRLLAGQDEHLPTTNTRTSRRMGFDPSRVWRLRRGFIAVRRTLSLSRRRNFVGSAEDRKKQCGDDARQQRSREDAEPDLLQHRLVVERQRADEEAHGEADSGQDGHGIEFCRRRSFRHRSQAQPDRKQRRDKDTDLLADEKPSDNAKRYRLRQL